MKLWNPAAFFISLIMSIVMAVIFGMFVPSLMGLQGLEPDLCLYMWPLRWVTAYLLINIIIYPIGFGLAEKIFPFNPNRDGMGLWNPAAFFISLMMSFIMAAIFGLPMGLPADLLFYMWLLRWVTAYLLINILVIFSVLVECVLFAWIFKAEKLIDFMNRRSKGLKLGKWWLVQVKYIIPILLIVILFGGLHEILAIKTAESLIVVTVLILILIILSVIFTLMKARTKEWFETKERIN